MISLRATSARAVPRAVAITRSVAWSITWSIARAVAVSTAVAVAVTSVSRAVGITGAIAGTATTQGTAAFVRAINDDIVFRFRQVSRGIGGIEAVHRAGEGPQMVARAAFQLTEGSEDITIVDFSGNPPQVIDIQVFDSSSHTVGGFQAFQTVFH